MASQSNKFDVDKFYNFVTEIEGGSDKGQVIEARAEALCGLMRRHSIHTAELLPVFHELEVEIKDVLSDAGATDRNKQYVLEPSPATSQAIPYLIGRVVPYNLPVENSAARHDTRRLTVSKMLQGNKDFREVFDVLVDCDENVGWFYPHNSKAVAVIKAPASEQRWDSHNLPLFDYDYASKRLSVRYGLEYESHFKYVDDLGNLMEPFDVGTQIAKFAGGTAVDVGATTSIQRM